MEQNKNSFKKFRKKVFYYFGFLFILSAMGMILINCGKSEDRYISESDARILKIKEVSNFIYVLPVVMDFANSYYSSLSPAEHSDEAVNAKYFKDLRKSEKVGQALEKYEYESMDHFIFVYKNVVMAYSIINQEITNGLAQIKDLENQLFEYETVFNDKLSDPELSKNNRKKLEMMLIEIEKDKINLSNVRLVYPYVDEIMDIQNKYVID